MRPRASAKRTGGLNEQLGSPRGRTDHPWTDPSSADSRARRRGASGEREMENAHLGLGVAALAAAPAAGGPDQAGGPAAAAPGRGGEPAPRPRAPPARPPR